jgi:hypothetical protein
MKCAGHVARMGEKRNAYRLLVGKPEGKSPLGRPRRSWVDNIKTGLLETGWGCVDWIDLAQDRDKCRAQLSSTVSQLQMVLLRSNTRVCDVDWHKPTFRINILPPSSRWNRKASVGLWRNRRILGGGGSCKSQEGTGNPWGLGSSRQTPVSK